MYLPVNHSMLRRCKTWDYQAPRIYSITITLAKRKNPLLGKLLVDSPPNTPPELLKAHIQPTELGRLVTAYWNEIAVRFPEIQMLAFQLMEEHLHGALYVTRRLPKHLGLIMGGFKGACTTVYRQMTGSREPLFSKGFQDTILFQKGQLERMLNYIADNPRRLAVKRLYPNLFTTLHNLERDGGAYTAYGNSFLLDRSSFHLLQVSRSITDVEMIQKHDAMLQAISHDAAIVSACISPGEKMLMREALEAGASLIALKNNGFPAMYKPAGRLFDACADGRLLLLAPSAWGIGLEKKITREQCYVLNALAAKIADGFPQAIRYHGQAPENLESLLWQAGFR